MIELRIEEVDGRWIAMCRAPDVDGTSASAGSATAAAILALTKLEGPAAGAWERCDCLSPLPPVPTAPPAPSPLPHIGPSGERKPPLEISEEMREAFGTHLPLSRWTAKLHLWREGLR